ncbi:NAD-dependent deacetylase [Elusimicrobiota bacterium]
MDIKVFKSLLEESKKIVGFTGSGISTESGIPDYRSQGGTWKKYQPVYYDEFLNDDDKRLLYWRRKQEQWDSICSSEPNNGHKFFKDLFDRKKLLGLITQNIDGLHERSGIPTGMIVNLHGNTLETGCLDCGNIIPSTDIFSVLDLSKGAPRCGLCNGLLKPNTISFGQQLDPYSIEKAKKFSIECDLMLIMGSTLIVNPAVSFPLIAKQCGAKMVIINLSETPLDEKSDFVIHMKIGEFVEKLNSD